MAVYKNENGRGYRIVYRNPKTKKVTTIRTNDSGKPFLLKKDAKEFELIYLNKYKNINRNVTMDELFEKYVEYLSVQPSNSTKKLRSWYTNHIKKSLGKRKISTISTSDLEKLSREMVEKNYSINYINKNCANIKTMLNYAVSHDMLVRNNAANFKPLKKIKSSNEVRYWEPYQFKMVIDSIPEVYSKSHTDPMYIKYFLMFGYLTGCRKGEQRALKWTDIEYQGDTGIIHINHHINEENKYVYGRKNGNGYSIYMDEALLKLVKEMRNYFSGFEGFKRNGYIFPSLSKGFDYPIGGHTPVRWMEELAEYNGLPHITYHGLRHSYVCYLSSKLGLTVYEVADCIGDTVAVVLEHYYQFFNQSKIDVANKITDKTDENIISLFEDDDD